MAALDDPALARLWDAAAERLQRNGLMARGVVVLAGLDRAERFALAGLLGRPVNSARARVDLAALDSRLCAAGAPGGLVATVAAGRGPLVDRAGLRSAAAAQRSAVWEVARSDLAGCGLEPQPWMEAWLAGIRPIVGRIPPERAKRAVRTTIRCVARLPWDGPRCGRTELASRVSGSSHALDDGTVLAALVLRAISLMVGAPPPQTPAERRALWERAGVLSDEVSTTVLTFGLHPRGGSGAAVAVRARSDAGCEAHLTIRDLRRLDRCVAEATTVWVCENPRVLEAAMDAGTRGAVVCTAGNPTVVVTMLLERLVADGACLRYRGDFDWPGLAMANRVVGSYAAEPWRMGKLDYEAALTAAGTGLVELPKLQGRSVPAIWDPDLTVAMENASRAVHEEALLDLLVADLVG